MGKSFKFAFLIHMVFSKKWPRLSFLVEETDGM